MGLDLRGVIHSTIVPLRTIDTIDTTILNFVALAVQPLHPSFQSMLPCI